MTKIDFLKKHVYYSMNFRKKTILTCPPISTVPKKRKKVNIFDEKQEILSLSQRLQKGTKRPNMSEQKQLPFGRVHTDSAIVQKGPVRFEILTSKTRAKLKKCRKSRKSGVPKMTVFGVSGFRGFRIFRFFLTFFGPFFHLFFFMISRF